MMRFFWVIGALLLAAPASAAEGGACTVARPVGGNLKAYAAAYFPKATDADIDALLACLAAPDPTVRDGFAFTLWFEGLRGKQLSESGLRHAAARLSAILAAPDDAAGFRHPFAALALAEVARADRIDPFLTDAELHALAETGAAYLRGVTDYRGFVAGEGWRHGVAHGADLMLQLALNPRLARADADLLLGAIAAQVAPDAAVFYHYGESHRLAAPVLFLAKRTDIDTAAWAAWFQALAPDGTPRWQPPFTSDAKLAAVHNATAFAEAVYVSAAESQDPQIHRLAAPAADLLRALP